MARLNENFPQTVNESYTSPILFTDGATRNLRFQVTRTYGQRSEGRVWAMSEFQVHDIIIDEEASPYHQKPWVKEAFDALQAQLQATRTLIADNTATTDDALALRAAIERAEEALLNTDGIEEVKNERMKNEKSAGAVFDLSGRKVINHQSSNHELPHGIYIIKDTNGSKKIVK